MNIILNKELIDLREIKSWPIRRGEWFLQRMLSPNAPSECEILGLKFEIEKGVFSPAISRSTEFFVKELIKRCVGKKVFEVGCGSGAISIHCALAGAKRVFCTDVSSIAIKCTKKNAKYHNVLHKMEIREARGFNEFKDKFDLIFFGLPYVYIENVDPLLEKYGEIAYSIFDEKYKSQIEYFTNVSKYMKEGGAAYVAFSKVGDLKMFEMNLSKSGLIAILESTEKEGRADNQFYRLI